MIAYAIVVLANNAPRVGKVIVGGIVRSEHVFGLAPAGD